MKDQMNKAFIKSNAWIVGEMQRYYKEHGRPDRAVERMWLILRLFLVFGVLRKNPVRIKQKSLKRQRYPESSRRQKNLGYGLIDAIQDKNIIIFDLWNVLVCSALDTAHLHVLFETVTGSPGITGYSDFCFDQNTEMYRHMEEIILDFSMDNKYMHSIWNQAKGMGKKVYLYNNSDFQEVLVRRIAEKFGYEGEFYYGDKSAGFYITTNSKEKEGIRYRDVNEAGGRYRPFLHTNVVTDFYSRYVNLKFHAGWPARSIFYEYGFVCGGILTCGFCQYLNELAAQTNIDKLLFVSRDGYILKKIYDRYYKKCDTAYLVFSRLASYEIIFEDFPEEYLDKNIRVRMRNGKYTIGEILHICGLLCLEEYLGEQGLSAAEELDDDHYERFRQFLLLYKEVVAEAFRDSGRAAKKYFMQEIEGYNNVCVVDLGWRGTSAVYLRYLFQEKYGWHGNVTGAMVGAAMDDVTQTYVRDGMLHVYAFDSEFYRGTGVNHGGYMLPEELFCIEALFSSTEPSVLRYKLEYNGKPGFIYGPQDKNTEMITEIQKGIIDYAQGFVPLLQKYHLAILARDAYMPLDSCMQNRHYRKLICQAYLGEKEALSGFETLQGE